MRSIDVPPIATNQATSKRSDEFVHAPIGLMFEPVVDRLGGEHDWKSGSGLDTGYDL